MAPALSGHMLIKRKHDSNTWLALEIAIGVLGFIAVVGLLTVWYRHRKHKHLKDINRRKSAVLEAKGKYAKLDDEEEMTDMHGGLSTKSSTPSPKATLSRSRSSSSASSDCESRSGAKHSSQMNRQSSPYNTMSGISRQADENEVEHRNAEQQIGWTTITQSQSRSRSPSPGPNFFSDHKIPDEQEINLAMPQPTRPRTYGLGPTEHLYDSFEERGRALTPHDALNRARSASAASQVMTRNASMLQPRSREPSPATVR